MAPSGSNFSSNPPSSTGATSSGADAFLLEEYKHLSALLRQNEDAGDKRITFLLSLTTAVGSGLAVLASKETGLAIENLLKVANVALAVLLALGVVTLRRVHKRNMTTDSYKKSMDDIRSMFTASDSRLLGYNPFPTKASNELSWKDHRILKGGLLTITCLLNSLFIAALSWINTSDRFLPPNIFAGGVFILALAVQWFFTADKKKDLHPVSESY